MKTQDSGSNIDLFGANVKLWIENNGEMVPFKSIVGAATDYIESINIRIGLMEIFQVEIKLSPPLTETEKMLNSGKIGLGFSATKSNSTKKAKSVGDESNKQDKEYHLNKIAVQLDYGGLKSPIFKAILLMPEINISESGIDVTIKGVGMLFEQTKKTIQFNNEVSEYDAIVKLLSAKKSINLVFDPKAEDVLKNRKYKPKNKKAFEEAKEILNNNGCKLLYKGSSSENGIQTVEIIHTNTIRSVNKENIKYKFVAFKDISPNNGIFPILSMSAPVSNIVASSAFAGAKNAVLSKSTKEIKSDDINGKTYSQDITNNITTQDGSLVGSSESSVKGAGGESSSISADGDDDIVGKVMGSISKDGDVMNSFKGVMYDWMEKVFKYELTTVLIPNLLPAQLVYIGIANIKALSNSYDLTAVEHNITQGGLETVIHCAGMGGLASSAASGANKVAGASLDKINAIIGVKSKKTPKPVDIE